MGVTFESLIVLIVLSVFILVCYADHMVHSYAMWRAHRNPRAFRGFFISVMLLVGIISLVFGGIDRVVDIPDVIGAFIGAVLRGMLLVGGLLMVVTWRMKE